MGPTLWLNSRPLHHCTDTTDGRNTGAYCVRIAQQPHVKVTKGGLRHRPRAPSSGTSPCHGSGAGAHLGADAMAGGDRRLQRRDVRISGTGGVGPSGGGKGAIGTRRHQLEPVTATRSKNVPRSENAPQGEARGSVSMRWVGGRRQLEMVPRSPAVRWLGKGGRGLQRRGAGRAARRP